MYLNQQVGLKRAQKYKVHFGHVFYCIEHLSDEISCSCTNFNFDPKARPKRILKYRS